MRKEKTLSLSEEYHVDGTGSSERNIYLPGVQVTVDSILPKFPVHMSLK